MAQMNDQEKAFWYQRFTLEGRIFYPDLLEPKAGTNGKLKFGTLFAWKMGSNQQETARIGAFLAKVKQDYFPTIPEQFFVNPVKRFDTYLRQDGRPNHEFLRDCYWLNASSGADIPPMIVNSARQPVIDKAEVYSGRNAVINITFWKNSGDKKGAGVNVNAVMLMPGGNKEGGSVQINVNDIFGSFAKDMGAPAAPAAPAWPPTNNGNGMGGLI